MKCNQTSKPTIWILDDQWRSALTKISWFFNYTEAAFSALNSPEALKALEQTDASQGWRLKRLQPSDIRKEKLRNGIALIDVNWSAAPSSETCLSGLSATEREHYGITLAEELLTQRQPDDNLELILFSHTKGSRLTAFYVDLMKRGVERVHPVVILDETSDGPLIRSYGWDACCRVTGQLLQQIPGTSRKAIADRIEATLQEADYVQTDDFTAGLNDLMIKDVKVCDLAVPFYQRSEAEEARASTENASLAGLQPLRDWNALIQSDRVTFELPDELANQPTALIRALLRYGKVDHLDGFLFLRESRNSRYADPVALLKKAIHESKRDASGAVLYESFTRIVSVGLGTPIRKLADGVPFADLKSTPFQNLPAVFHDRSIFDVAGSTHTPEAKISIFDSGETGFRIKVSQGVIWENRIIHATGLFKTFLAGDQNHPEQLLKILEWDPGNIHVLLKIAQRKEALLQKLPKSDVQWKLVREATVEQTSLLRQASESLEYYADQVASHADYFSLVDEKAFTKDVRGSNARCQIWDAWHHELNALLNCFDLTETAASKLLDAMQRTHTSNGSQEFENLLGAYLPRVRGYANKTLEKELKRKGLYNSLRLKQLDRAFGQLFPKDSPHTTSRNWVSVGLAALGTHQQGLSTMSPRRFESKLIQLMGKELVQKITALTGYEILESVFSEHPEN